VMRYKDCWMEWFQKRARLNGYKRVRTEGLWKEMWRAVADETSNRKPVWLNWQ
jgi:hypothetical protein